MIGKITYFRITSLMALLIFLPRFARHFLICRGPASAESRDTLRMNGVGVGESRGKKKRERERKNDTGRPSLGEARPIALFSKGAFIP